MVAGYFQHRLANPPVNNRSAVCILGGCRCVLVVTRWYGADGQTLDMAGDQRRFNGLDQTLRLCSGAGIYQRYGFLVVAYTRPGGSRDLDGGPLTEHMGGLGAGGVTHTFTALDTLG